MSELKAHQVEAWLRKPDVGLAAFLVYGPDRGLVSERSRQIAKSLVTDLEDPFGVVKLGCDDVEVDPGRLFDEASTVSMFGGFRLIWLSGGGAGKRTAEALAELLVSPPQDARILIEAGDLKKSAPIRTCIEKARQAIALPCYGDGAAEIERLMDAMLGEAGKSIALDARQVLRSALGGDRMASRGEIEKLILHAGDASSITLDDITAMIGDSAGLSVDGAIDAVLAGDLAGFDRAYNRLVRSGTKPFLVAAAMMRQFQQLQGIRARMDGGMAVAQAMASERPPVFYQRRDVVTRAASHWSAGRLMAGLERLQGAVLETRRRSELEEEIVRQALIALGLEAGRGRRS
jgi:DNA polymerase-3 subunit delta